ncbi:hypothetical protein PC115_g15204 [Phytophthora cactorum]|uniref:Uncharacterized protein n=1 Tax=Phytophthora cactorum TaxID=29920 RepID=A0A8T1BKF5_9STRA|nr:hypothetical protein PC115_g15204 [Phytophthora cactorum]
MLSLRVSVKSAWSVEYLPRRKAALIQGGGVTLNATRDRYYAGDNRSQLNEWNGIPSELEGVVQLAVLQALLGAPTT